MLTIKNSMSFLFLSIAFNAAANNYVPDQPSSVLYAPTITINPDEQFHAYPSTQLVKLLINEQGKIEKIYYPKNLPEHVISKIESNMKFANFSPYKRNGIAVKSIVPYYVNFYTISEEEYSGH